ncbi:MAG TPA: protein kinase [Vicinamibacteria bacterium]|nr:protein kinase [Vicinamibacteria bacterium]
MDCPACRAENAPAASACFACGAPLDPALSALSDGSLFASRFDILGPLGRGGMGMVYRAFDRELGEAVAIKVLRPDLARGSARVERRFRSEIRLARRVRHRNVCSVYGNGEDRGLLYVCMELVEGENLAGAVRRGGGLPPAEAWNASLQVADGLRAIHEVGIVHRDLKTANLMRDRHGVVRVMDFGIAKLHTPAGGGAVTVTGPLVGTPEYMSPEQLRGDEVDFRSDLYSLGVVIYELFTGSVPFRGDTPVATIVRQLHDAPRLDQPKLPPVLRPVLARALAKSPAERFATAADLHRALATAAAGEAAGPEAFRETSGGEEPGTADETRPVAAGVLPERVPILRMAAAQVSVAALAVHLLGAGGVRPATVPRPPVVAPMPAPAPTAVAPPPAPATTHRPIARSAAPRPTPIPTPLAAARVAGGAIPPPAEVQAPTPVPPETEPDRSRVYDENEVDQKPRRIAGMSAPYPEWGPKLGRGQRVSITASFVVTEEGLVTDIRVESGGGVLEAVLPEISRWRYEPGRKGGVAVKVRVRMKHTFIGG